MKLQINYLLITLFLLITEIIIALFVHDNFIRPFFGDFLAVILVYTALMSVTRFPHKIVLIGSLFIAYSIEILQFFKFIEVTGLIKYRFWAIVIGNSFSWLDMLAYTLGGVFILLIEKNREKRTAKITASHPTKFRF